MADNVQKQLMIKSLPPFPIDGTIVLKELNLNEILRLVGRLLPQHVNEKIHIKLEMASMHLPVAADKTRMGDALVNLVQNAAEAMLDGGILTLGTKLVTSQDRPPFQTECCTAGACALISVADNGVGMNPAIKKSMFEPYFTTKEGAHRGLGLPIAYSVIRRHNGCIKVESAPGKGTTIKVYLPLLKGATREEDPVLLPRSFFGEVYGEYRRC
jgi:signal transduction histidine kinase